MIGIKRVTLQTRVMILITATILLSISVTILFFGKWSIDNNEKKVEAHIQNISKIVARSFQVQKGLKDKNKDEVKDYVRQMLRNLDEVDMITIADMKGISYTHPNQERVGKTFIADAAKEVIKSGKSYVLQKKEHLGFSIQAFEPVFYENEQVGFVMTAVMYENIKDFHWDIAKILSFTFLGILLGVIGAWVTAKKIRDSLLGLEPDEIVYLYRENRAMLKSIKEGIIAIDSNGMIRLVNDYAVKILNLKDDKVVGKHILDFLPTSNLLEVIKKGKGQYNQEQIINNTVILANRVPIKDGEEIIGAMTSFYDLTKVKRLAEEITGVQQIIHALRANTHEFKNKLHVILGLIELDEIDEVKKYIKKVATEQEQLRFFLTKKIKNPTISAIILGKLNRSKELKIQMEIDEDSYLEKYYEFIESETLVTIIGNLLDNAMEAIEEKGNSGEIFLSIKDQDTHIEIVTQDNGMGIPKENMEKIFTRGFTTKPRDGGIGLYLIHKTVHQLNGNIHIDSKYKEGTTFYIKIPKEG